MIDLAEISGAGRDLGMASFIGAGPKVPLATSSKAAGAELHPDILEPRFRPMYQSHRRSGHFTDGRL